MQSCDVTPFKERPEIIINNMDVKSESPMHERHVGIAILADSHVSRLTGICIRREHVKTVSPHRPTVLYLHTRESDS